MEKGPFSCQIPASLLLMVTERTMCTKSVHWDELSSHLTSIYLLGSSKFWCVWLLLLLTGPQNISPPPPTTSVSTLNCLNKPSGHRKECNLNAEPGNLSLETFSLCFAFDENYSKQKLSKWSNSCCKSLSLLRLKICCSNFGDLMGVLLITTDMNQM